VAQFLAFLQTPDAIPLLAAELVVLFSKGFEAFASSSMEIDEQYLRALMPRPAGAAGGPYIPNETDRRHARAVFLLYCSDMVWRVGLLSAVPFSALGIGVLAVQGGGHPGLLAWAVFALVALIVGVLYIIVVQRTPVDLQRPMFDLPGLRWLSYHRFGDGLLHVLNIVTFMLSYNRFLHEAA
jgi:hypothetical protein